MLNSPGNKEKSLYGSEFTVMVSVFPFITFLDLMGFSISETYHFYFKGKVNILCVYESYSGKGKLKVEAII